MQKNIITPRLDDLHIHRLDALLHYIPPIITLAYQQFSSIFPYILQKWIEDMFSVQL